MRRSLLQLRRSSRVDCPSREFGAVRGVPSKQSSATIGTQTFSRHEESARYGGLPPLAEPDLSTRHLRLSGRRMVLRALTEKPPFDNRNGKGSPPHKDSSDWEYHHRARGMERGGILVKVQKSQDRQPREVMTNLPWFGVGAILGFAGPEPASLKRHYLPRLPQTPCFLPRDPRASSIGACQ